MWQAVVLIVRQPAEVFFWSSKRRQAPGRAGVVTAAKTGLTGFRYVAQPLVSFTGDVALVVTFNRTPRTSATFAALCVASAGVVTVMVSVRSMCLDTVSPPGGTIPGRAPGRLCPIVWR